ncbi:hypothetical protein DE146DRAFT_762054 [Phaeosphaeria sp. MPI-PUGE-AT-0046c]|nr:hypothetical protein DE146DRAFT_762054 [Phaeosphaeria sp. MPI-PUGE-AT-0046c]
MSTLNSLALLAGCIHLIGLDCLDTFLKHDPNSKKAYLQVSMNQLREERRRMVEESGDMHPCTHSVRNTFSCPRRRSLRCRRLCGLLERIDPIAAFLIPKPAPQFAVAGSPATIMRQQNGEDFKFHNSRGQT